MVIKDGYNKEPSTIGIIGREKNASEIWIKLAVTPSNGKDEFLLYATTDELVDLRDELNAAIRDAVGL